MTVGPDLRNLREHLAATGGRLYIGATSRGIALADPQQALLVLGPPRSGKTVTVAVPNVIMAPGAVVATSTKADLMAATISTRASLGTAWLLDPSGTTHPPPGTFQLRWSPAAGACTWDESLVLARAMVGAARPEGKRGDSAHWTERAEALIAPLLHAAWLAGAGMEEVAGWVLRQEIDPARQVLDTHGLRTAVDVLSGIAATDPRELSGIWSSAAGVLAAYRSDAALDSASAPNFDPARFVRSTGTVYICAPARHQELVAPIVVAFVECVRSATYSAWAAGELARPVTVVLDEVANIAPLPGLPSMVSEGGGQGVLTIACLQDLSQARQRWGAAADGFLSLFGAKLILPGIGDLSTLEIVSRLGGEVQVPAKSVSRSPWWAARAGTSETWSPQRQRRLPVEAVYQQRRGSAIVMTGARPPERVRLPPWRQVESLMAGRCAQTPGSQLAIDR
jgi:type IV secretion system protein VirD4